MLSTNYGNAETWHFTWKQQINHLETGVAITANSRLEELKQVLLLWAKKKYIGGKARKMTTYYEILINFNNENNILTRIDLVTWTHTI